MNHIKLNYKKISEYITVIEIEELQNKFLNYTNGHYFFISNINVYVYINKSDKFRIEFDSQETVLYITFPYTIDKHNGICSVTHNLKFEELISIINQTIQSIISSLPTEDRISTGIVYSDAFNLTTTYTQEPIIGNGNLDHYSLGVTCLTNRVAREISMGVSETISQTEQASMNNDNNTHTPYGEPIANAFWGLQSHQRSRRG